MSQHTPVSVAPEFLALQRAVAGRYSLDRELGRGGMGIVFLARDVTLDRPVAIKLFPPALAAHPELRERFLREARTAARLAHPHIVPVHAVEAIDGLVFFVMMFVDGETLGQRVHRIGPLPSRDVMRIVREVAWALAHAHAQGVVHRDVKPDNILLERGSGRALVTDFGIAAAGVDVGTPAAGVTGTPQYMSPEQAMGGPPDPRSDLYSLAAAAFFAATGRPPFASESVAGLLTQHAGLPAPPVGSAAPRLPSRFAAALDRCLAKDPAARFSSASDFAATIGLDLGGGAALDAPPPIRSFLREEQNAGMDIATSFLMSAGSLGVYAGFFSGELFASYLFLPVSVLMFGLGAARFGQVVLAARDLVRQGYGHAAVKPVLLADQQAREEEAVLPPGTRRRMLRATAIDAVTGVAKTGLAYWLAGVDGPVVINFLGAAGLIMFPALFFRRLWTDLRRGRPGLWSRFLGGRFGTIVFRIARVGQRAGAQELPVAGEPTVLALGRAVDQVFQALPAAVRNQLGDVPALIDRLQAEALQRRVQTPDAGGRVTTSVVALEAVRLDLLRLHAGTAPAGELTRNLEHVRGVGGEIDRLLAAHGEVEGTARSPDTERSS